MKVKLIDFSELVYELDDLNDNFTIQLSLDGVHDVNFGDKKEFVNLCIFDIIEDRHCAIEEENRGKIKYYNSLIEKVNKIVEDKKEFFLKKLEENYKRLEEFLKNENIVLKQDLNKYHKKQLDKFK